MVKIGFSKIDLKEALRPVGRICRERVEAICFYAESKSVSCVWVVLDFMDFNKSVTDALKNAVANGMGLLLENIHIVTTHNHGGGEPDVETLAKLTAEVAKNAKADAKPAMMRYVFTLVDKQVNYIRRLWIPEIEGVGTLFFGASDKNGYDSACFVENLIDKLRQGRQCYSMGEKTNRPYSPFPAGDEELMAIQFRTVDGETIGTIVRFAAHAVCCNRDDSFSSDYPFYVRRRMEELLGGTALFFNGPCGDIAPGMTDKFDGTEVTLGEYLAEIAVKALDKIPFELIENLEDTKKEISLPVRKEVMDGFVELPSEMPEKLNLRRKYLDKKSLGELMDFLRGKYILGETEISDEITVQLGLLRLGNLIIVGFPGETFSVTGRHLQEAFPGTDICTVTEHERTVMYLPPEEDSIGGSYESVCRVTDHKAEEILLKSAKDAMRKFLSL